MNPTGVAPRSGLDRLGAVLCHVSAFLGFPFLLPLVVYLVAKGEGLFLEHHAGEAFNFHLSVLIYGLILLPLLLLGSVGIYLAVSGLLLLAGTAVICSIQAAIWAAENRIYFYPLSLRLVGR